MVELTINLNNIFSALSHEVRRDIVKRVIKSDLTISEIAQSYTMSFAGIAKHIVVLEKAKLITKRRDGTEQIISASPKTITLAASEISKYEKMWESRFDRLEELLNNK